MSHCLGAVFKYLAAAAIFVFSLSLSYTYFSTIAPHDMPWFTPAALGLTEFGFICWLAVFMLQKHHDAHKTIAFLMVWICLFAVLFTDAVELARLFGTVFFLAQFYYYGLIVLLLAHFLAFALDFFVSYFEKNSFTGGTVIRTKYPHGNVTPPQYGNLIPTNGGYSNRPFALRNQPKDTHQMEAVSLGQVATANQIPQQTTASEQRQEAEEVVTLSQVAQSAAHTVKEAVSTATKRVSRSKKRTKKVPARARGKTNVITGASTSPGSAEVSEEE